MTAPSISSGKLLLHCPSSWSELSQDQLRYVLRLISSNRYESAEIRTYMLIRFCDIDILKKHTEGFWSCSVKLDNGKKHFFDLQSWQVQDMIGQLAFIDKPEDMDVRLESIRGFQAVDALLHGLYFIDYLNIETCYQGWILTKKKERVEAMARTLYRDSEGNLADGITLDDAETAGVLFWFSHIKKVFAKYFPHFFKPVNGSGNYNPLEAINAQLRALTEGDVTKEETVKHLDCWRCLTELDAKARESDEFKQKYGNK